MNGAERPAWLAGMEVGRMRKKKNEAVKENWLVLSPEDARKVPSLASALSDAEISQAAADAEIFYVPPGKKAKISAGESGAGNKSRIFVFGEKSEAVLAARWPQGGEFENLLLLLPHSEVQACFVSKDADGARLRMGAVLHEGAGLKLMNAGVGSGRLQEETRILQKGARSRCEHYQAVLADGSGKEEKKSDHFHLAPDTYSRSVFKYATAGESQVKVDASVTIDKSAPGSDTHLLAKSLLLSERAASHVVPQLFVHNSEVAAGHGSALTPLSDEELFYLSSRGIGQNEGRCLVLQGFLQELLAKSGLPAVLLEPVAAEMDEAARRIFPGD